MQSRRTGRTTKLAVSSLKELIVLGKTTFVDHPKDNGGQYPIEHYQEILERLFECIMALIDYNPYGFEVNSKFLYIYDPTKWDEKGNAV